MRGIEKDGDRMGWPKLFSESEIQEPENIEIKISSYHPDGSIEQLLDELSFSFERIANRLRLLVGTKEFDLEINKLLIDDRGNRKGFPPCVISVLLKLSMRHDEKYNIK